MKIKLILIIMIVISLIPLPVQASEEKSLMIVAHPDDETIWGGSHLLEGKYTVLCITNGNNKKRKKEFLEAMKKAKVQGVILNYPDKTKGKRDNWKKCYSKINQSIKQYIDSQNWKQVVSHNPDGEYGHIHHKMVSKMVTKVMERENETQQLIYFGRYVAKKNKRKLLIRKPVALKLYGKKKTMIQCYPSQKKVMDHLGHMLPYENWVAYSKW